MPFLLPSHPPVSLHKPVLLFCWLAWDSARPSSPCPAWHLWSWVWLLAHPCWVTVLGVLGKYLWEAQWLYYCLNEQIACKVPRFWTLLFCHPFTLLCALSCWLSALGSYRFGILSGLVLDLQVYPFLRVCSILLYSLHICYCPVLCDFADGYYLFWLRGQW